VPGLRQKEERRREKGRRERRSGVKRRVWIK
jgi:hypothetical protein